MSWWQGDGTAGDSIDSNNGFLVGGTTFASGFVRQAFSFNGSNAAVSFPARSNLDVGRGSGLTIECWIKPADLTRGQAIAEWNDGAGGLGVQLWISIPDYGGLGSIFANLTDTNGVYHYFSSVPGVLNTNSFQHIALTFDKTTNGTARIFLNGVAVATEDLGFFTPQTSFPFYLGYRISGPVSGSFYKGLMDEVSLYNRALAPSEVLAIYNAGSAGKCPGSGIPPSITTQPLSRAVDVGATTTFTVTAGGTLPLLYQWSFNGSNILGATSTSLTLSNVQVPQAGNYAVSVTNAFGSILSSNALLTVNPITTNCLTPPAGLVSWWRGEGNGLDSGDGNNGVLLNSVAFAPGMVGQAFSFNGIGAQVRIPSGANLRPTNALTLEAWIKPTVVTGDQGILVKWDSPPGNQKTFSFSLAGDGRCYLLLSGNGSGSISGQAFSSNSLVAGVWTHVAATYDRTNIRVYVNGVLQGQAAYSQGIFPGTNDMAIAADVAGTAPSEFLAPFNGLIDELSFYGRALTASEIQMIYQAGVAGKCATALPPVITSQPQGIIVPVGTSASFSVGASGTPPFTFQWRLNGSNLPGATGSALVLPSILVSSEGNYSVVVSNAAGFATSSNALLSVYIATNCSPASSGMVGWWKGDGTALDRAGTNNGVLTGNATFIQGKVGQAFALDGSSDGVQLGSAPTLRSQTFTIEAWIQRVSAFITSQVTPDASILSYGSGGYGFGIFNDGRLFLTKVDSGNVSSTTGVSDTAYHHVAVTKDGTNVVFYIDGIPQTAPSYDPFFTFTTPVAIGARGDNLNNSFFGTIDELAVFNRSLSSIEIQGIYHAGADGKCLNFSPPFILIQPQSRTVTNGTAVSFNVIVNGSQPLSYQWSFNGTNIAGATASQYSISNVQPVQAGNYAVLVTNVAGSMLSSNALLTVLQPTTNCFTPPAGLVSWWRGEGNGLDSGDGNNGVLLNSVAFAPGMVGQAFSFNGIGAQVRIPSGANLRPTNALTLEAWIKPTVVTGDQGILVKWDSPPGNQKTFSFSLAGDGRCYLLLSGNGSGSISGQAFSSNSLVAGVWTHVAATYDRTNIRVYVNGVLQGQAAYSQGIFPGTNDMAIAADVTGTAPSEFLAPFNGLIDELSFYGRALTAAEIQSIYSAGSAGKCQPTGSPPVITSQPQSLTLTAGSTAGFFADASGTFPLNYQWSFNGTNISGATTTSLVISNVQIGNGGNYALRVTNAFGFAVSSNALLTVNPVNTNCVTPPAGLASWWRGEGDASDSADSNTGVLFNGVGFLPGMVGQAFNFNGTGAHVRIASRPNLRPTNSLTLEAWIKPTVVTGDQGILVKWDSPPGNQKTFSFSLAGDGRCYLLLSGNGSGSISGQAFSSNSLVAGMWTHVAATYDGTTIRVYVNGVLQGQAAYSQGIFPGTNDMAIAADVTGGSASEFLAPFNGLIDELSFYGRALTAAEIQSIYSVGSGGKCHGAVSPFIVDQPQSLTVTAGGTASFSASASGTEPLAYQWTFNGSNIAGATRTSLTLTNVQLSDAGNYALRVTNASGSAISSNALLTVIPAPTNCVAPPPGLVSWWPAEGNAQDIADGNSGTIYGGVIFTTGEVAQAFSLIGSNGHVRVSDRANLHFTTAMTAESWVNPNGLGLEQAIVGKWDNSLGLNQKAYSFSIRSDGSPYLLVSGNGNDGVSAAAISSTTIPVGQWSHVAGTYDGTNIQIYVNGILRGQVAYNQGIWPGTNDLGIGGVVGGSPTGQVSAPFIGKLDEVSLYNRALSAGEISSIYNARFLGKCHTGIAPSITAQPLSRTNLAGSPTTFVVGAAGTAPLGYQWFFNGTGIAGATGSSLTISNVQPSNAGNYSVIVSNAFGSVTSSNATLAVIFPPATVKVIGVTNVPAGGTFTVPVVLTANGNENALSFSINFDRSKLTYVSTAQGGDAGDATFFVNDGGSSTGRVGVALALPVGTTFPAGPQEVAEITFNVAIVTNATLTSIGFTDQPVIRQLADANGLVLPANYQLGTVSIAAVQFEGDVSPRTNGNQAVTVTDWVLIGRFAAGLDQPVSPSEFQRADCAPRSSLGNGHITVTDWVQAGRYVAGLDPLTPVGGPTGPLSASTPLIFSLRGPDGPSLRQVYLSDTSLTAGQSGSVKVTLHAQGDETALGFSLNFDPSTVSFVSARLADGVTGVTLNVNSLEAAHGRLGFVLGLTGSNRFQAGDNSLVQINFQATPTAGGQYSVAFGDSPVFREISDSGATALPSVYLSSSINIAPLPPLSITQSGQNLVLSWPAWASAFQLQSADSASGPWSDVNASVSSDNSNNSVTLPMGAGAKLYRLNQR